MQARIVIVALLPLVLVAAGGALAQGPESLEGSMEQYEEIIGAMVEYASDVEFTERDVESLLDLWSELEQLGIADEEDENAVPDFDEILADARYRTWAAGHGLDAENWFRTSLRIQLMMMREEMRAGAEMMEAQLEQQEAMIEQQCAQVGEEMCRQMCQGLEAMAAMGSAWKTIPAPTRDEAEVLERYQDQLMDLFDSGDEEAYEDW